MFNFQNWGCCMYNMNQNQRRVLAALAVVIAGMMLVPPFYQPPAPGYGNAQYITYGFLFGSMRGRVELGLLCMQFLTTVVVGMIAFILCANKQ